MHKSKKNYVTTYWYTIYIHESIIALNAYLLTLYRYTTTTVF